MKVSTAAQMRELDKKAVSEYGIPEELLMENAGTAAFQVILEAFGVEGMTFAVICGPGNNGGDGLVVARKIYSMGGFPFVLFTGDPDQYKGAAKLNFQIIQKLKIPAEKISDIDQLYDILDTADIIVDAVFGTGLQRNPEGIYKEIIETVNDSGLPVISLDIPSGINGDNGQIMGTAVAADAAIAFGLPKPGNLLYPGYARCGDLYVTHIGFPPNLTQHKYISVAINEPDELPVRPENGHKGTFGDVLFISGAGGYFGAPYFSAMSFLKAGGGYARLAAPESVVRVIGAKGSEIVFLPQKETGSGSIAFSCLDKLLEHSEKADMVVLGPGLSLDDETRKLICELSLRIEKPLLIDGDGLSAVSQENIDFSGRIEPLILTPHPGEMARLTGLSIDEILKNPVSILQEACGKYQAIIVLKGAHSLIGMPDGEVRINLSGNSGMATAGSGDVLSGIIAAMAGLGMACDAAVQAGVFLHGLAGDIAADDIGPDGMTAQDILNNLPEAAALYRNAREEIFEDYYGKIAVI